MNGPQNNASSPPRRLHDIPPVAGVKRPAPVDAVPSLLPAFEPLPSSPALPRPAKRVASSPTSKNASFASNYGAERLKYPTPVPTSSTGIVSSSPPHLPAAGMTRRRPPLQRTASAVSERAPLEAVPTIELEATGEPTLMGRSGRASTFQLSTNKLISRVHVRAAYIPANPPASAKVELVCTGWNGVKVHCQSKAWELGKDDTFTSESIGADIMLDVQDARVILKWPAVSAFAANTPISSDSESELDANTPSKRAVASMRQSIDGGELHVRPQSPISPTPNNDENDPVAAASVGLFGSRNVTSGPIQIYEDSEPENAAPMATQTQSTQRLTQPLGSNRLPSEEPAGVESDEDPDEENDPVVHSFGPSGANLLSTMASFSAASPQQPSRRDNHMAFAHSPEKKVDPANDAVANHVVNQLAFSRVASTPLSTIMRNLPAALRGGDECEGNEENPARLSLSNLKSLINSVACIGEVRREGRDAAGKPLESEFYYIPDNDLDENRRAAVVTSLQKPGLRNCRKSHKQYYWRKPK